ncbi:MAG: hypothetical protein JNM56_15055 [Planctomycetia bacterium]|nr:hypothetical protein [Planctomycetia bacterium]
MYRCLFASILLVVSADVARAADPTFWQDVFPVFRRHCTVCHKEKYLKELDVSGGLALDSYAATLKGAKQAVLQAGKSADSPLYQLLVIQDEKKRMPQGDKPLHEESITLIRRWIDTGAKEGVKPETVTSEVAGPQAVVRKLDVLLPTAAVPPKDLLGPGNPQKLELALKVGPLSPVTALAFSPDGKLLATGSYGLVTVWDLEKAEPLKTLTNVLGAVNCLRFSPDGALLAVAGGQPSARGEVRLYAVADWKLLTTLGGHTDVVSSVAFRPDGKVLATGSFDKNVRTWDLATYKPLQTHGGHSDFVYAVAFSPDGANLASASKDRTVKLVDAVSGKSLLTFSGMDQDVLTVAFSPDGKQVVSSGLESQLFWWNPKTGERVRRQGGHGIAVHEVIFSKDGKQAASAGADRTVKLWNADTGTVAQNIQVGSIVYAVALSPDGKRVAAGSFDGLVRLYDAASMRHLVTLLSLPPDGDKPHWLAQTPEGYSTISEPLAGQAQWRMAGKPVTPDAVWGALRQSESVAKAARGEALSPVNFGK